MKSESEREEDIGWGERKIGEVQKYIVLYKSFGGYLMGNICKQA